MPSDGRASKDGTSLFSRFIRRAQGQADPEPKPPQTRTVEQATKRSIPSQVSSSPVVSSDVSDSGGNGSGIGLKSANATSAGASGVQSDTGARTGASPPPARQGAVATTAAANNREDGLRATAAASGSSGASGVQSDMGARTGASPPSARQGAVATTAAFSNRVDIFRAAAANESTGAERGETTTMSTATTTSSTREVTADTSDLARSDEFWRLSVEATEKTAMQARLVEQATITTVETRKRLSQAEHVKAEAHRELSAVKGRFSSLDLEGLRKSNDLALKDFNRHSAEFVALSDDFTRRQANAERLRITVQEKGEALHQEIAARDAALARAAELRAEMERRQAALAEVDELRRRHTTDLASLKLGLESIEADVNKAEAAMRKSVEEDQALRAKVLAVEVALTKRRSHHTDLSALLADEEAAYSTLGKEWEARKVELTPLGSRHSGLVAAYEADRALLAEQEQDAAAALDQANANMANADRLALALAKAESDVKSKEDIFHMHHNSLIEAEQAAEGLIAAEKEHALAADAAEARMQQLLVQLRASEGRVDAAQAAREDYWKQAKYHGEEGDEISDRHFIRLSEGFPGGVDVKEMLNHSDLTARIAKEGLEYKGSETRITSIVKESGSSEKIIHDSEGSPVQR